MSTTSFSQKEIKEIEIMKQYTLISISIINETNIMLNYFREHLNLVQEAYKSILTEEENKLNKSFALLSDTNSKLNICFKKLNEALKVKFSLPEKVLDSVISLIVKYFIILENIFITNSNNNAKGIEFITLIPDKKKILKINYETKDTLLVFNSIIIENQAFQKSETLYKYKQNTPLSLKIIAHILNHFYLEQDKDTIEIMINMITHLLSCIISNNSTDGIDIVFNNSPKIVSSILNYLLLNDKDNSIKLFKLSINLLNNISQVFYNKLSMYKNSIIDIPVHFDKFLEFINSFIDYLYYKRVKVEKGKYYQLFEVLINFYINLIKLSNLYKNLKNTKENNSQLDKDLLTKYEYSCDDLLTLLHEMSFKQDKINFNTNISSLNEMIILANNQIQSLESNNKFVVVNHNIILLTISSLYSIYIYSDCNEVNSNKLDGIISNLFSLLFDNKETFEAYFCLISCNILTLFLDLNKPKLNSLEKFEEMKIILAILLKYSLLIKSEYKLFKNILPILLEVLYYHLSISNTFFFEIINELELKNTLVNDNINYKEYLAHFTESNLIYLYNEQNFKSKKAITSTSFSKNSTINISLKSLKSLFNCFSNYGMEQDIVEISLNYLRRLQEFIESSFINIDNSYSEEEGLREKEDLDIEIIKFSYEKFVIVNYMILCIENKDYRNRININEIIDFWGDYISQVESKLYTKDFSNLVIMDTNNTNTLQDNNLKLRIINKIFGCNEGFNNLNLLVKSFYNSLVEKHISFSEKNSINEQELNFYLIKALELYNNNAKFIKYSALNLIKKISNYQYRNDNNYIEIIIKNKMNVISNEILIGFLGISNQLNDIETENNIHLEFKRLLSILTSLIELSSYNIKIKELVSEILLKDISSYFTLFDKSIESKNPYIIKIFLSYFIKFSNFYNTFAKNNQLMIIENSNVSSIDDYFKIKSTNKPAKLDLSNSSLLFYYYYLRTIKFQSFSAKTKDDLANKNMFSKEKNLAEEIIILNQKHLSENLKLEYSNQFRSLILRILPLFTVNQLVYNSLLIIGNLIFTLKLLPFSREKDDGNFSYEDPENVIISSSFNPIFHECFNHFAFLLKNLRNVKVYEELLSMFVDISKVSDYFSFTRIKEIVGNILYAIEDMILNYNIEEQLVNIICHTINFVKINLKLCLVELYLKVNLSENIEYSFWFKEILKLDRNCPNDKEKKMTNSVIEYYLSFKNRILQLIINNSPYLKKLIKDYKIKNCMTTESDSIITEKIIIEIKDNTKLDFIKKITDLLEIGESN